MIEIDGKKSSLHKQGEDMGPIIADFSCPCGAKNELENPNEYLNDQIPCPDGCGRIYMVWKPTPDTFKFQCIITPFKRRCNER